MKKINFKSTTILNKKFDVELSGYDANDVDSYLDLIIDDYAAYEELQKYYEQTMLEKAKVINDKDEQIQKLKLEIVDLKAQLIKTGKATNLALLEKFGDLEKKLMASKNEK